MINASTSSGKLCNNGLAPRGLRRKIPLGSCHINNLLEIPPQMVNDRERVCLAFRVEQVLKFSAPDRGPYHGHGTCAAPYDLTDFSFRRNTL